MRGFILVAFKIAIAAILANVLVVLNDGTRLDALYLSILWLIYFEVAKDIR